GDVHLLERALRRRRVHEPRDAAGRSGELLPAAHLAHGHAHGRSHRLRPRCALARRPDHGGNLNVSTPLRSAAVTVRPVADRADLNRFIRFPWRIYANDPVWVPPLLSDLKTVLDRRRHPFHQHADVEYFLARRGDEVVGRIAAIVNHRHNEFHEERTGFFGFFECIDDADVAGALLETAEAWLRERGMERVYGPESFSTNEESGLGLLVDGFDKPPVIMMAHTPPYYPKLVEGAGYVKAKDLLAYWLDDQRPPERLVRGVERLRQAERVKLRTLNLKDFAGEVARIKDIYNSAWERNWGFVPMTDAEFDHLARQLRPVVNPRLCAIAEVDGEPVGFALALPELNHALKHVDGRLLPLGPSKVPCHRPQHAPQPGLALRLQ